MKLTGTRRVAPMIVSSAFLLVSAPVLGGSVDGHPTGHVGSLTDSGPIVIDGERGTTLENLSISNPGGTCVVVKNSTDILLENLRIGPCGREAVRVELADGVTIQGSTLERSNKGVYALRSSRVRVIGNDLLNLGRNLVQFDKVNGPGSLIWRNYGVTVLGNPVTEDLISIYRSNGQQGSPIRIHRNRFMGGGRSLSGSGILPGDYGGSNQVASENTLVDPGQVGIGVASGTRIEVLDNRIFQEARAWSNVALYAWNQTPFYRCRDVAVQGNRVNWRNASGQSNGWYDGGGCGDVRQNGNDFGAPLNAGIFDD